MAGQTFDGTKRTTNEDLPQTQSGHGFLFTALIFPPGFPERSVPFPCSASRFSHPLTRFPHICPPAASCPGGAAHPRRRVPAPAPCHGPAQPSPARSPPRSPGRAAAPHPGAAALPGSFRTKPRGCASPRGGQGNREKGLCCREPRRSCLLSPSCVGFTVTGTAAGKRSEEKEKRRGNKKEKRKRATEDQFQKGPGTARRGSGRRA